MCSEEARGAGAQCRWGRWEEAREGREARVGLICGLSEMGSHSKVRNRSDLS